VEQSLTSETKGDFMGALYLRNSATSMKHSEEGAQMAKKNVHVTHRKDKSWAVISEGDERASSLHDTQQAAIKTATPLAKARKSELVIHNRENRIRDKDSYGNDPNPPKDKKH